MYFDGKIINKMHDFAPPKESFLESANVSILERIAPPHCGKRRSREDQGGGVGVGVERQIRVSMHFLVIMRAAMVNGPSGS